MIRGYDSWKTRSPDDGKPDRVWHPCPECHGHGGWIKTTYAWQSLTPASVFVDCENCMGTGGWMGEDGP